LSNIHQGYKLKINIKGEFMQKKFLALLLLSYASSVTAEQVCHKCEVIREENKKKVNKYEFYEDYLKDHPEEANKIPTYCSENDAE
jgi:hypothetical protein